MFTRETPTNLIRIDPDAKAPVEMPDKYRVSVDVQIMMKTTAPVIDNIHYHQIDKTIVVVDGGTHGDLERRYYPPLFTVRGEYLHNALDTLVSYVESVRKSGIGIHKNNEPSSVHVYGFGRCIAESLRFNGTEWVGVFAMLGLSPEEQGNLIDDNAPDDINYGWNAGRGVSYASFYVEGKNRAEVIESLRKNLSADKQAGWTPILLGPTREFGQSINYVPGKNGSYAIGGPYTINITDAKRK